MSEYILLFLMALLSVCVCVLTIVVVRVALRLRRILIRVDAMLPGCQRSVRQVNQILLMLSEIVTHANRAMVQAESAVERACSTAAETVTSMRLIADKAQSLFKGHTNGVSKRSHVKRSSRTRRKEQ